jgi:murein DD-endopeptidase MepM/ murein hydrolase activator NlpD
MFDFLKKILSLSNQKLTVLIWEESTPDETENFAINPSKLLGVLVLSNVFVLVIAMLFFYLTPVGSALFSKDDQRIREQLFDINDRVLALRDSLDAREIQLQNFKKALAEGVDTTFQTSLSALNYNWIDEFRESWLEAQDFEYEDESLYFSPTDVILSTEEDFFNAINFPLHFPLEGSLTRRFEPVSGHFGIDIATSEGTIVRSFGQGVVFFSGWTVNYGYVIGIQHSEGYLSIYKHCLSLLRRKGDIVHTNDILGTVGSTGLISSGPHLHFELWKNGRALDPSLYFTNL